MTLHAKITGTGSATPKKILSNKDLESIIDTTDEWITRRSGIRERRISMQDNNESTAELAARASLKAMDMAGVSPEKLDMIVMGTVTPDRQFPSAACMVQKTLNAENAAAFDISAGCSGFLYALSTANNAIQAGTCKTCLVIGAERLSSIVNWQDRGTCVLLGDGAGAIVVSSTEAKHGILSTHIKSNGKLGNLLFSSGRKSFIPEMLKGIDIKPFQLNMDGRKLFKNAIDCLSSIARQALTHNSLSHKDIALVVPHQANIRIIEAMAKELSFPMEKVYTNIHKYGNTSSASIPIALDEAYREGRLKKNDNVLLVSFGAGLTWGSSIVKWCM